MTDERRTDDPLEGPGAEDQGPRRETIDDIPGMARLAASAAWHTTEWAARSYARLGLKLLGAATQPERASELAEDVRDHAREVTGQKERGAAANGDPASTQEWEELRVLGAEVMRKSRDVNYVEAAHPAYERILGDLAPDEARILHLFMVDGPQPSLDVRTGGPFALLSSHLIAQGFTMIGGRAGCRYPSRVPQYLNNLHRLGMIWFSRETLHDPVRYQVLEAQPDVLEATGSVRMAKVVRRSIHLTPFGEDFCRICLAIDGEGQISDLPAHTPPPEGDEETDAVLPPPMAEG